MTIVAALVAGLVLVELRVAMSATSAVEEYVAAGGHVVVVDGRDGVLIPAKQCEELNAEQFTKAAGTVVEEGVVEVVSSPGHPVRLVATSSALPSILDPSLPVIHAAGAFAGTSAASRFALSDGSVVGLEGLGSVRMLGALDASDRAPEYSAALLSPSLFGSAQRCFVEMEPFVGEAGREIVAAAYGGHDDVRIGALAPNGRFGDDPEQIVLSRSTKLLWPILASMLAVVASADAWFRRSSVALYRAYGMGRTDVILMLGAEWMATALPAFSIGVAVALAVQLQSGGGLTIETLAFGLRSATAVCAGSIAVFVALEFGALTRRPIAILLKDQ
ncbi:MAG: hypothetical protein ABFR89_04590 [Actinomycetota bacterium]